MKKIMEHYASAAIAAMTALAMMAMFYHLNFNQTQGIAAAVGTILEATMEKNEWKIMTGKAFDTYVSHTPPTIFIKNNNALHVGEATLVSDFFIAKDNLGNILPVEVKACWDVKGNEVGLLTSDRQSFYITKAGAYWVRVSATDNSGFEKEIIVKIYVNER